MESLKIKRATSYPGRRPYKRYVVITDLMEKGFAYKSRRWYFWYRKFPEIMAAFGRDFEKKGDGAGQGWMWTRRRKSAWFRPLESFKGRGAVVDSPWGMEGPDGILSVVVMSKKYPVSLLISMREAPIWFSHHETNWPSRSVRRRPFAKIFIHNALSR